MVAAALGRFSRGTLSAIEDRTGGAHQLTLLAAVAFGGVHCARQAFETDEVVDPSKRHMMRAMLTANLLWVALKAGGAIFVDRLSAQIGISFN